MPHDDSDSAVLQATVDRLRAEAEGYRQAMRTRAVIEQAKGLLTERLSCTPDQAFGHLVRLSQDSNRKLVQIAAGLLGIAAPPGAEDDPPGLAHAGGPAAQENGHTLRVHGDPQSLRRLGHPERSRSVPSSFAARYHLAAAALASAESPDALAALLNEVALAPLGVAATVLALLEPDGALRLVGSDGVPAHQLSQWQRIPPQTSVPLTEAAQRGATVWVHSREEFAVRYPDLTGEDLIPGRTVCALPLRTGERLVGAMKLGWPGEFTPDRAATRYLSAVARLCAAELLRVLEPGRGGTGPVLPTGEPWFRAVLDALLDPVLILTAVREPDGRVTDLRVDHANAATVDMAGRTGTDVIGRRVTELYPGMVASGAFRNLLDVAATGTPYEGRAEQFIEVVGGTLHASTMTLHATPFLDGVLVSWRTHDEQERRESQLAQAQHLAGLGTWSWEHGADRLTCSGNVPRLLGLDGDADPGALDLEQAIGAVAEDDRPAVRTLAGELLAGHPRATLEFRIVRPDGVVRNLRAMAEAVPARADGEVLNIRGVVQDVSAWRRTEDELSRARSRLAEQRRRNTAERQAFRALQHALVDLPAGAPTEHLETAARYRPAETGSQIGGDWYDVLPLPDGTVLITVGDVAGHGLQAAARMTQLRYALRGMAFGESEAGPARLLGRLNRMLCHLRGDSIATAVCGRFHPRTRGLTWARAGHPPPVLAREGAAGLLGLPAGPALGVTPDAHYETAVLPLASGDTVLLFTDGLVERRDEDLGRGLARLVKAVDEYRADGIEGFLDHVMRRLGAPGGHDDTCLLAVRVH
ncbi:SpoIIE family protein phosphatase [Kitasatospora purpeofusca]|uniref:SpoIIE family protein phosphatase n=1 Tax=Kitasatospora purpeofusca TaxID=67352 RepID=UPI002A59BB34|nr:SpoIIE family protein phosphatase [Kitasatospora purpeofusca]MDY0811351.1 SpoIIE family protein phosphatase [Kitasatospora purpeofusca]